MFPRDMVCLKNISVNTLHKGDTEDNNNNNNNNNNNTGINYGFWAEETDLTFLLHGLLILHPC
jgi:hypothetical protein